MIAFSIGGIDIYWYGIFYLITFVTGYRFLRRVGHKKFFIDYPGVHRLLTEKLDDLFLASMIGVLLGGRLGHVFLYDWAYYAHHLNEILHFRQGGMSFVGGALGVAITTGFLVRKYRLTKRDLFLLGDVILCIVPLGIFLGRIGNFLNQELVGKPLTEFGPFWITLFETLNLAHVYDLVDSQIRVNANIIQSVGEGLLMGIIIRIIFRTYYMKKKFFPGQIVSVFLLGYSTVRFFAEYLKELPANELVGAFSASQLMMIAFFVIGLFLQITSKRARIHV